MKRARLERKTAMQRGSELRRTPFPTHSGDGARLTPIKAKTDKSKRKATAPADGPSESVLERRAKDAVSARSGGECEVRSPWHLGRATNFSHRRHSGQGGPWSASNGLDSCGWGNVTGCHGYIHQHPEEARENGWIVSAHADWKTTPVLMWYQGRRAKYLLDDEGGAGLAPFPQGDPRHPDDIPAPGIDVPRPEEWLPIPSTEGRYEASSRGQIRSVDRVTVDVLGRSRRFPGVILRPKTDTQTGYLGVVLGLDGKPTSRWVHSLVAEAFLGPRPLNMQVAHGNGDRTNNDLANLRYATVRENAADRLLHGTDSRGSKSPLAVLTEEQVREVVALLEQGLTQKNVAARFGVHRTTVAAIAQGRSWGHLTGRGGAV